MVDGAANSLGLVEEVDGGDDDVDANNGLLATIKKGEDTTVRAITRITASLDPDCVSGTKVVLGK
jgi:hypothetical protein